LFEKMHRGLCEVLRLRDPKLIKEIIEKYNLTLGSVLEWRANISGSKPYVIFKDEQITYKECNDNVNKMANVLLDLGIKKGDHVGFMLPNSLEMFYALYAPAKIGAVFTPINIYLRGESLKYILKASDIKLLITTPDIYEDKISPIKEDIPKDLRILLSSELKDLMNKARTNINMEEFGVKHNDVAYLIFTSGTTGLPKGVMHSHANIILMARAEAEAMRTIAEDIFYTCLPLFHLWAGGIISTHVALYGITLVLDERFSASKFWSMLAKYKVTQVALTGTMLPILLKLPITKEEEEAKKYLMVTFQAPIGRLFDDVYRRWPDAKHIEIYGLTEHPCMTFNIYENPVKGSAGKPWGYEVKIVDEEGKECPPGKPGEIVCRGVWTMLGYYKNPEATQQALRDGFLHTGDFGRMDENGYLYFVDRGKDGIRIRKAGEMVSSLQVEQVINAHPKVAESAVFGVPSDIGDDEVCAHVVVKKGETLTPEELIEWCSKHLPYFAVPRYIVFRDSLPKTATERVEKYKLRMEGLAHAWDREKAGIKLRK